MYSCFPLASATAAGRTVRISSLSGSLHPGSIWICAQSRRPWPRNTASTRCPSLPRTRCSALAARSSACGNGSGLPCLLCLSMQAATSQTLTRTLASRIYLVRARVMSSRVSPWCKRDWGRTWEIMLSPRSFMLLPQCAVRVRAALASTAGTLPRVSPIKQADQYLKNAHHFYNPLEGMVVILRLRLELRSTRVIFWMS